MLDIRSEFKDVSSHPIISQLRALVGEPEFEALFNQLTENEDSNTRFLLRMELRRVAAPCQRVIDLRPKGIKRCQLVEYKGQTHYMDEGAKRVFEAGLKEFAGRYTMAIFDDIERYAQSAKLLSQDSDEEDEDALWLELVRFGSLLNRDGERMHFATPVVLRQQGMGELSGSTSDISASGAQVLLAQQVYVNPELAVELTFPKLTDSRRKPWPALAYQVISQQENRLKLKLKDPDETVKALLENLIEHNQKRYKLDIRHIQETTRSRGFEQMQLNHSSAMAIFFNQEHLARYCLTTHHNRPLQNRLFDGDKSLIPEMLSPRRVKALLEKDSSERESYILRFEHHQQGKVFQFAADIDHLRRQGMLEGFLRFAASKPGWQVLKVNLFDAEVQDLATLDKDSNASHSELQLTDTPLPKIPQELLKLSSLAILRDVTQEWLTKAAQEMPDVKQDPNQLAPFCVQWRPGVQRVAMRFNDMRIEPRYRYKTPVQLYTDGKELNAELVDFSTQGLCINLQSPLEEMPAELDVALPKLQKLSSRFDLMQMPYRLMHFDAQNQRAHLMIQSTGVAHPAKRFFRQLIDANEGRLQRVEEDAQSFGIARALRQSLVASALPCCLFVQKDSGKIKPQWLGLPVSSLPLPVMLSRLSQLHEGQVPLDNLMSLQMFRQLIDDWRDQQASSQSLLVALDNNGLPVMSRLQSQLPGPETRRFLEKALEKGRWGVWQLELVRTPKPDMHYIQQELNFIGRQALHRAKRLEADLWSTVAMIEVTDITAIAALMLNLKANP
ncbi:PilZ domain-containing protein [Gallaecimonas mangrovi]|uniref:PilZ domain-containing protein n=1 Tax=Gallaecimonas mangrovi TaxID=2291597 RepID=UPI000E20B32D|nr:PilZ domain-containing protein [Gallaecimonas mangrovi]